MESVLTSPSTALDTRLLHSAHWLDILEAASEETQSAHHRLACARSAAFSHALPYLLQRAISSTNGQNSANVANGSVGNNIGANDAYVVETLLSGLCIRLWLVVLSLLEDDDKDVRSEANSILSDVIRTVNLSSLDILTINSNTTSNEDKLNISNGTKTRIATVEAYTLAQLAPYLSICISWRVQLSVSQDPVLQLLLDRVQWGLGDIDAAESFIAEYSRDQVGTIAQTKVGEFMLYEYYFLIYLLEHQNITFY